MPDRVLVVDDDPALLSLETAILEAQGYEVTPAEGGVAAIELLRAGQDYDLVVSDLDMPVRSGMDVLEAIRELAPDTVAIICTSHGRVEVAVQALKAGAFDFIQKPFAFDHYLSVVQRGLEHRRLRDQTNIYRAAQVVFSTTDPDKLPQIVVETACRVLQADYAAIFSKTKDGYHPGQASGTVKPGQAMMNALCGLCSDVERMEDALRLPGDARVGSPHGMARVLKFGSEIHGVLWVLRAAEKRSFAPRDVDNSMVMAAQASLAIANAKLVNDLKGRIVAMEKARRRIYTSSRIEGIGRMAIDVAQQLQNPVQYMRSNLREVESYFRQHGDGGSLMEDEITLEGAEKRLAEVFTGLSRVDQAVSDLSSIAQNRENQKFELGQAVTLAVRLARLRFEPTVEIPVDAVVHGAPGQMAQAIVALLTNADQAMGKQPSPVIRISVVLDGKVAVLTVEDNGEGIPAELLPVVTSPFFSTRGRDGIGLDTAREVVEYHGGKLELQSTLGHGTRVTARIPAEAVEDEFAFDE